MNVAQLSGLFVAVVIIIVGCWMFGGGNGDGPQT